jgi:hypothetical protein
MHIDIVRQYDSLVPADRLLIDTLIKILFSKDEGIRKLLLELKKMIEKQNEESKND